MMGKMFELGLHAKAENTEELDNMITELGRLHVRNGVGINHDTLEISYTGKAEPVQAGLLLNVFTNVKEHTVTAKSV